MLTSTLSSATSMVRAKTLDDTVRKDEQKDLEEESEDLQSEEPANNTTNDDTVDTNKTQDDAVPQQSTIPEVEESQEQQEPADPEETSLLSVTGLSQRADAIKLYLQETSKVQAICLKADGSSEEISYDTTSTATRQLLSARPSIVGEIEDLQLIVVQSMEQSNSEPLNTHTLPGPLGQYKSNGNYLLFRVNSEGKAVDVTLKEYQQYVEASKPVAGTATVFNSENVPIKSNSPFASNSDFSMKTLRGAVENRIYIESEANDTQQNEDDIQKAVKEGIQKLVDDVVAALSVSPMEDPDYKPEDEEVVNDATTDEVDQADEVDAVDTLDDRSWRMQLQDAIEHIQNMGKMDGALFAEQICSNFQELNGTDPELDQLVNLYSKIRTDFANEAEEELDDQSEASEATESEIDTETDTDGDVMEDQWEETLDLVREIGRSDGLVLAESVLEALSADYGAEPSLSELTEVWQGIQDELAAEADEETAGDSDEDDSSEEGDYDEAMEHVQNIGKMDGEAMASNLCQIMLEENGQEPSLEELTELWQGIQDKFADEAQEEMESEDESEDESESESEDESSAMTLGTESELDDASEDDEDSDDDYEPGNARDQFMARWDTEEDLKYEMHLFDSDEESEEEGDSDYAEALAHVRIIGKLDGAAMASNLCQIMSEVNGEEPSLEELSNVWQGIQDQFADEAEEEIESMDYSQSESEEEEEDDSDDEYDPDNTRDQVLARWDTEEDVKHEMQHFGGDMLLTQTSEKGNGVSWNVYFDERELTRQAESSNLKVALENFKLRNNRAPTILECKHMATFLAVPNEQCNEEDVQAPVVVEVSSTKTQVFVAPVVGKEMALWFNVYLEEGQQFDVDSIVGLFQRSNGREPNSRELDNIRAFAKSDQDLIAQSFELEEMIDIE